MTDTKTAPTPDRWRNDADGLWWEVANDTRLPHSDHIEMSGRKVSVIARYTVDADRRLSLSRDIIYPQLRTKEGDVRGYTRRQYGNEVTPAFTINGEPLRIDQIEACEIDPNGFCFYYAPGRGSVRVARTLFPLVDGRGVLEMWQVSLREGADTNDPAVIVAPEPSACPEHEEVTQGVYGRYFLRTRLIGPPSKRLTWRDSVATWGVLFSAQREGEPDLAVTAPDYLDREWEARLQRAGALLVDDSYVRHHFGIKDGGDLLTLETPDEVLNGLFAFARFRAAECLFDTAKMGLVHSPTGGSYYGGVWANDQAEYSGPLFAYLGDPDADEAARNAYAMFARAMEARPDYRHIPSSFEMEGTIEINAGGGDRGDAAMVASGLTRYLMARGDRKIAEEFWPAVEWCLEFCRRRTNENGVVASRTDELEGRFPTGDANLSTSALAYDGLRGAAHLARDLGKPDLAAEYDRRADALAAAIETHFGATVEGFPTYRYYDGNTTLRSWIALPLCFGLLDRAEGTIAALFSPRLWTPDGLATESGDTTFWDRATLYALRGVFRAGETETALRYLTAYSRRRLLGDHVPYPVEAYPEGGQAHLSAESALYCRVFTEGLFGLEPTGLRAFRLTPRLPADWKRMQMTLPAFGHTLDVRVAADGPDAARVTVTDAKRERTFLDETGPRGATYAVTLPG